MTNNGLLGTSQRDYERRLVNLPRGPFGWPFKGDGQVEPASGTIVRSYLSENSGCTASPHSFAMVPDGRVFCAPTGIFNNMHVVTLATRRQQWFSLGGASFRTATYHSDGYVYVIPFSTVSVRRVDITTFASVEFGNMGTGRQNAGAAVIAPDNCIYAPVSSGGSEILLVDPVAMTTSLTKVKSGLSAGGWETCVLTNGGYIYCLGSNLGIVGKIDWWDRTSYELPAPSTVVRGSRAHYVPQVEAIFRFPGSATSAPRGYVERIDCETDERSYLSSPAGTDYYEASGLGPDGMIYAKDSSGNWYIFNPYEDRGYALGSFGSGAAGAFGDLVFDSTGTIYGLPSNFNGFASIVEIQVNAHRTPNRSLQ